MIVASSSRACAIDCAWRELGDRPDHRQRRSARLRLGVRIERREDLRVDERHCERRREDADDRVRLAVDHERRADDATAAQACRASTDR